MPKNNSAMLIMLLLAGMGGLAVLVLMNNNKQSSSTEPKAPNTAKLNDNNTGNERISDLVAYEYDTINAPCSKSSQYPVWQTIKWQAQDGGGIWSDTTSINSACKGRNPCVVSATNEIMGKDPWSGHKKKFTGTYFCTDGK
ncbi:MAG TPA: hypothetical protein V6C97_05770 [Oculatellaceae cyanobacterium]